MDLGIPDNPNISNEISIDIILNNGIRHTCADVKFTHTHDGPYGGRVGTIEGSKCPRCKGNEGYYFRDTQSIWFCGNQDCLEKDALAGKPRRSKYRYVS